MNTKKILKEEMLKEIFIQTGGREENIKIADVCATIAVNFITSNGMLTEAARKKNLTKCTSCDEMVEMTSSGEFCPRCFC